jgi:hypothetical protein
MDSFSVFSIMVGAAGSSSESRISMTSESVSRGLFTGVVTTAGIRFLFRFLLPFVCSFSELELSEISITAVAGGWARRRWEVSVEFLEQKLL